MTNSNAGGKGPQGYKAVGKEDIRKEHGTNQEKTQNHHKTENEFDESSSSNQRCIPHQKALEVLLELPLPKAGVDALSKWGKKNSYKWTYLESFIIRLGITILQSRGWQTFQQRSHMFGDNVISLLNIWIAELPAAWSLAWEAKPSTQFATCQTEHQRHHLRQAESLCCCAAWHRDSASLGRWLYCSLSCMQQIGGFAFQAKLRMGQMTLCGGVDSAHRP